MKQIGIIGVGGIANSAHIPQLLDIEDCKITAICDINESALLTVGEKLGLDNKHRFTDYKKLIDCDDVDAVEICTPNYLHIEMAEYTAKKGKPMNIEKPLCLTAEEAEQVDAIIKENNITNMMSFSYRFAPSVRYAKWIMEKGLIGKVVSINVEYLKSSAFMEGRRLDWRFVKKYAGTGVLGDLGVHLIDMAQLLVGDIKSVSAMKETVVKQRMKLDSDEFADVETDDICNFIANVEDKRTGDNVLATFAITRCAIGNQNTIKYNIYGTEGMISFDLNNSSELGVCIGEVDKKSDGLHTVQVPNSFYITQEKAFIDSLHGNICEYFPTVEDGIKCQKVIDAIDESTRLGNFVSVM